MSLSTISSPNGKRDIAVDLTDMLEPNESLATATLVNTITGLTVTNPVVLTTNTTVDDKTIATGKGFSCTITTTVAQSLLTEMIFFCVGDSNTSEHVSVPLKIDTKV